MELLSGFQLANIIHETGLTSIAILDIILHSARFLSVSLNKNNRLYLQIASDKIRKTIWFYKFLQDLSGVW